jgi:hypothetical protein
MEDPRCKGLLQGVMLTGVAIEIEDPRYNGMLRGVVIEMEDPRCKGLRMW